MADDEEFAAAGRSRAGSGGRPNRLRDAQGTEGLIEINKRFNVHGRDLRATILCFRRHGDSRRGGVPSWDSMPGP